MWAFKIQKCKLVTRLGRWHHQSKFLLKENLGVNFNFTTCWKPEILNVHNQSFLRSVFHKKVSARRIRSLAFPGRNYLYFVRVNLSHVWLISKILYGKKFSRRFNFAGFFNKFWISRFSLYNTIFRGKKRLKPRKTSFWF